MAQPRRRRNGDRIDVSLFGISDTELLGIIDDLADENGWATSTDVRLQLGENPEDSDQQRRSGVGPRLGWMVRYGWLEKVGKTKAIDTQYRLTAMGHAILDGGDLSRTFQAALEKLNPAQRVRLTRAIAEEGVSSADEIKAALRREWRRNFGR